MDPDFRSVRQSDLPETQKLKIQNSQTPDVITVGGSSSSQAVTPVTPQYGSGNGWKQKFHLDKISKIKWAASIISVLVGGLIIAIVINHTGAKPVAHAIKPVVKPVIVKPTITLSPLTGEPITPSYQPIVTGVMIENTIFARPQSGLGQAGVVFEAVAEGGVTRFLALFQDTNPSNIGPIRSARPYYVQWAMGFDAGYSHVGGSPDALADIKAWGTRNLDEFQNAAPYHRISARAAPHNMYSSIPLLNQLENSKGYTASKYDGFPRKAASPAKVPTAKSINMVLSGPIYNAHYDYNAATNTYNRSEGGAPQIDANTNTQISPNVVIAIVVPESRGALDTSGAYYSNYASLGSGPVYVYQDGTVTTGQWTKSSPTTQMIFTNSSGQPLNLNPGQTWITAVSSAANVTSAP